MSKTILVTGACGGIGRILVKTLLSNNYSVIATDKNDSFEFDDISDLPCSFSYVKSDLNQLVKFKTCLDNFNDSVVSILNDSPLHSIVHNAAFQVVKNFSSLNSDDWSYSLNVNLLAPVAISNKFLQQLKLTHGSIIHLGSIHSNLTKPGFTAYATTKAALTGLTKSMAVELGGSVRVNAIEPAAIATPMLEAGFANAPKLKAQLEAFHPTGSIGTPEDVARAVLFLIDPANTFLNGCVLPLGGGIHSRLHDPV